MNHENENENLSESHPDVSAVEAALAQLRPRREGRFADEVKSRVKEALSDRMPASQDVTKTVEIPLTHYIRVAQFNAATGGLLAGLFLGILFGGAGVYFVMSRLQWKSTLPVQMPYAASSPHEQRLLQDDTLLSFRERALLLELDKDPHHGRR
ncbi:MAG: hypothetical protein ACYC6N_12600 [Pirellulaceae bacterium]